MSQSMDDTLRSTSPIQDEERELNTPLPPEKPTTQPEMSLTQILVRRNSYTLEQPSVALLVAERVSRTRLVFP